MTLFKVEPIEIPKYKTLCYVGDDLISFWAIFDDTQLHISRMNPIMLLIILNGFTPKVMFQIIVSNIGRYSLQVHPWEVMKG